jgi:hypothetical protein
MPKCKIEWCERRVFSKHMGLCSPHYQQARQDAKQRGVPTEQGKPRPDMPLRGSLRGVAICTQPGCDRLVWHETTRLCQHHYWRDRRHGDPSHNERPRDRKCMVIEDGELCPRKHKGHGLCKMHLDRQRADAKRRGVPFEQGNPLAVLVVRNPMRGCSVEGCDRPHDAKGLCTIHYQRWLRHGVPTDEPKIAPAGAPLRFIDEVAIRWQANECLYWPFHRKGGYARLSLNHGLGQNVCRIICERVHGPPPSPSHHAAHSCGNGHLGCVNPRHLSWLTPKQNGEDRRGHTRMRRGQTHFWTKLTEGQVRTIRSLEGTMKQSEMAPRFGVKTDTISCILRGRSWSWLK